MPCMPSPTRCPQAVPRPRLSSAFSSEVRKQQMLNNILQFQAPGLYSTLPSPTVASRRKHVSKSSLNNIGFPSLRSVVYSEGLRASLHRSQTSSQSLQTIKICTNSHPAAQYEWKLNNLWSLARLPRNGDGFRHSHSLNLGPMAYHKFGCLFVSIGRWLSFAMVQGVGTSS